jgi:hypothetical protein
MRQMCHMVYEDMRYDHPDYIHRVLGNLIFLRFIVRFCPADHCLKSVKSSQQY